MSSYKVIEDVEKQKNNKLVKHSTVAEHHIENKVVKSVGNIKSNGALLTTTATTSRAKILLKSDSIGKSVVSSLSMSLERKNSIQYTQRKTAPYSIPVGQNSVIHLDNCTHIMARRVTTTKTIKRAEISEDFSSNIPPSLTQIANSSSVGGGDVGVGLKVVLNGGDSSYYSNKKALNMNKQKLQDAQPVVTPSNIRGRKNSLALDYKLPKELKVNLKKEIPNISTPIKQIIKKPARPVRKKILKPKQPRKPKIKTKSSAEQINSNEESDKEKVEKLQISPFIQSKEDNKILRPCPYTLQSKKCLNEISCAYLHSNFPCKYYYLNIPCPQDFKCQFMHNGPLEDKLKVALRHHILDLLSTKPSSVETYFVQQIHYIDDLSHRLLSFQLPQTQSNETIEVMDDADDDHVLVIDETGGGDVYENNNTTTTREPIEIQQQSQYTLDKLDMIYEKYKNTNIEVDEIGKKLKSLKTSFNISPTERIHQLQIIYDLLKKQEKCLDIYESATSKTQLTDFYDNQRNAALPLPSSSPSPSSSNTIIEKSNVILVNPNIVNDIQIISEFPEVENSVDEVENINLPLVEGTEFLASGDDFIVNLIDDDESNVSEYGTVTECLQPTNSDVPKEIEIPSKYQEEQNTVNANIDTNLISNLTQENGNEIINLEEVTNFEIQNHNDITIYSNDNDTTVLNTPSTTNNGKESLTGNKEVFDTTNSSENCITTEHNNNHGIEISDNNKNEILEKNISSASQITNTSEISDINSVTFTDNDETILLNNDSFNQHNETIINEDDSEETNKQPTEEQSPSYKRIPTKAERKHRIRLRSHVLQGDEEMHNVVSETQKPVRPIRARRLRLPKPNKKPTNKSDIVEYQINPEVINELIKSTAEEVPLQHVEIPPTQNVILTKRFLKKTKHKLDNQTQLHATNNDINIDNKIANTIEDVDVSVPIQTSDENNSSQPVTDAGKFNSDMEANFSENEKIAMTDKQNILPAAARPSEDIKDKYNLGNPQVLIAKLKIPCLLKTTQNAIQADSTTSNVNRIVDYSSYLLADEKFPQKRRSLDDENDLDLHSKANKYFKLNNSESAQQQKIDCNESKSQQEEWNDENNERYFETDASDEKLTPTSTYNNIQQQDAFESSSTHQEDKQQLQEQTENENASSKSDLQLQTQQQQKNMEIENESDIAAAATTNNLPQEEELELGLAEKDIENEQYEESELEEGEIVNTSSMQVYDNIENDEDEPTQSFVLKRTDEAEQLTPSPTNKYSNELSAIKEEKLNAKSSGCSSSLFNKFINKEPTYENSSVNVTPISSPTYDNENTIASPSPIRGVADIPMGGEIEAGLTYPPILYRLHEIDLGKIEVNKPLYIDKLKKTIQLDPRIFRTHIKKQSVTMFKKVETNYNALVPLQTMPNNINMSHDSSSSSFMQSTSSMISPYDPRNRSSTSMLDITTPSLPHQNALMAYNSMQTAVVPSSSASFMQTGIPNTLPLPLQYHSTPQPTMQTQQQQQQTPNMMLYNCLQRSPWYQSLMSTMKIQINQSISQLVRALNNFYRERVFNPQIMFDVFKIDCAGELLEIMRNLGIFVDANGVINEQREMPSFAGHSSCSNNVTANAAYSFIQQYLTPKACCNPLTSAPLTCNAANHSHEPFVSCYIKAPEPPKNTSGCCCCSKTHHSHNNDNNTSNRNCHNQNNNNNNNDNNDHYGNNNNNNDNNNNNNSFGNKRYGNQFKKPYDNNDGNNNNNSYQQRSNQRPSYNNNYNNNPRFIKPGDYSPSKSNTSPSGSPKRGFDGGSGGFGAGTYGGRGGRGGGGGRFFNNRRFNNKDNNNDSNTYSISAANNNKYQNNNSPPRSSSPSSLLPSGSPSATEPPKAPVSAAPKSDEESWD